MIFLGIDPGTITAGYCIIKKDQNKIVLLDYGALCMKPTLPLPERVALFYRFFKQKIEQHTITHMSIETPFAGKNLQNFLKLGYLRGIIYLLTQEHAIVLTEYSPQQIKLAISGHGHADKDTVARIIMRLFPGLSMPAKQDTTDAIAIALCGIWKHPIVRL